MDTPQTPPSITLNSINGIELYSDWTSEEGTKFVRPASVLIWPQVDATSDTIQIGTTSQPLAVELRLFTGELSPEGVPTTEPVVMDCLAGTPSSGCIFEVHNDSSVVRFQPPSSVALVVLNVRWFVPASLGEKSPGSPPANVLTVGWHRGQG